MGTRLALLVLLAAAGGLLVASQTRPLPESSAPRTIDLLLDGERLRLDPAAIAERVPLPPGADFGVAELGRDAHSSHHAVAIRTAELPHRHDRHDLLVVTLRGHGTWRVGERTEPVGAGSVLYVPRGTPHAFTNHSPAPAIAFAVYTPAFDGTDRVEVE